jgi:hypothetical protein
LRLVFHARDGRGAEASRIDLLDPGGRGFHPEERAAGSKRRRGRSSARRRTPQQQWFRRHRGKGTPSRPRFRKCKASLFINSGRPFFHRPQMARICKARQGRAWPGQPRVVARSRRQAFAGPVRDKIFVSPRGVEFGRVDVSSNVGAGLGSESSIKTTSFHGVRVNAARDAALCV